MKNELSNINLLGYNDSDSLTDLIEKNEKLLFAALALQEKLSNLQKEFQIMQNENELEKKTIIQQLDKISSNYEIYAQSHIKLRKLQDENLKLKKQLQNEINNSDNNNSINKEITTEMINEIGSLFHQLQIFNDKEVMGELYKKIHLSINYFVKRGFDWVFKYGKLNDREINNFSKSQNGLSLNSTLSITPLKIYKMNGLNGEVKAITYRKSGKSPQYTSKKMSKANSTRASKNNSVNNSFISNL